MHVASSLTAELFLIFKPIAVAWTSAALKHLLSAVAVYSIDFATLDVGSIKLLVSAITCDLISLKKDSSMISHLTW